MDGGFRQFKKLKHSVRVMHDDSIYLGDCFGGLIYFTQYSDFEVSKTILFDFLNIKTMIKILVAALSATQCIVSQKESLTLNLYDIYAKLQFDQIVYISVDKSFPLL